MDKVKAAAFLASDRVHVLREAIMCCRKTGTISVPGVYVGMGEEDAAEMYKQFRDKGDGCIKVVLRPEK